MPIGGNEAFRASLGALQSPKANSGNGIYDWAWSYDYKGDWLASGAQTQSGAKSAGVDPTANFSPDVIKGAHGVEYTGGCVPYKKEERLA